ncbi:hypothetical protein CBI36_01845 [Acetobacter oryzifermentans]|uniref:Uncharacterized protein n=2 Tax=Acetobacter TaxID=434 RepID=A0AAN1U9Z3_9PROT|nr:hypothetical protein CBI36_01845 [Acetobacter oryzifermentans]AXN01434.1 hypothetical protein CJF59_13410 [Acetobacter pomorum]
MKCQLGAAKILLVGGPLDGEYRSLPYASTIYVVRVNPAIGPRKRGIYELEVETLDGGEFYFQGWEDLNDRDCRR